MVKSRLKRFLARWPWLRAAARRLKGAPPSSPVAGDRAELFPGFEVTAADTLVDVGCGPGQPCVLAGNVGADVIAVDIDPDVIRQVERTMRGVPARSFRAVVSDCDPLPLPDDVAELAYGPTLRPAGAGDASG